MALVLQHAFRTRLADQYAGTLGEAIMAWLLIRTFLITPLVFLVAAPILLALVLHASLDNRSRARRQAHRRNEKEFPGPGSEKSAGACRDDSLTIHSNRVLE